MIEQIRAPSILAVVSCGRLPRAFTPGCGRACVHAQLTDTYDGVDSDSLSGTVSVKGKDQWATLWHNRTYTGSNLGSMEAWLLLRSIKTLALRVPRQAETATALAQWLCSLTRAAPGSTLDGPEGVVEQVWHVSLQADSKQFLGKGKQMEMGSACFGILLTKPEYALHLPHSLNLFTVRKRRVHSRCSWLTRLPQPATSLGGVESLIEQRRVSDAGADPRLSKLR